LVGAFLGISALMAERNSDRTVSSGLALVDIAAKTGPEGSRRIIEFMMTGAQGFTTLDQAAVAVVAHTSCRTRPVNYGGLKKVLRQRDERHLV
jgi:hypothetical protein